MTVIVLTNTALTSFTIPGDWSNTNTVEVIGGGAGGAGGSNASVSGGGGGGGAYSRTDNIPGLSGSVTIAIGTGGTGGGVGGTGGDTWFNGATLAASSVGAKGGTGGSSRTGGAGGVAASGVGTTRNSGGNGGTTTGTNPGGGGGGSGAPSGTGHSGVDNGGGGGAGSGSATDGDGAGNGGKAQDGTAGGTLGALHTAGNPGSHGSGGGEGGSAGAGIGQPGGAGGAGGDGIEWVTSGGGGGAGGGGQGVGSGGNVPGVGGTGGLYGGGGGGGGSRPNAGVGGGAGNQGVIVITYTPAGTFSLEETGTPPRPMFVRPTEMPFAGVELAIAHLGEDSPPPLWIAPDVAPLMLASEEPFAGGHFALEEAPTWLPLPLPPPPAPPFAAEELAVAHLSEDVSPPLWIATELAPLIQNAEEPSSGSSLPPEEHSTTQDIRLMVFQSPPSIEEDIAPLFLVFEDVNWLPTFAPALVPIAFQVDEILPGPPAPSPPPPPPPPRKKKTRFTRVPTGGIWFQPCAPICLPKKECPWPYVRKTLPDGEVVCVPPDEQEVELDRHSAEAEAPHVVLEAPIVAPTPPLGSPPAAKPPSTSSWWVAAVGVALVAGLGAAFATRAEPKPKAPRSKPPRVPTAKASSAQLDRHPDWTRKIPPWRTLQEKFVPCSRGCASCPHGPYWYAYWKDDTNTTRCAYVGGEARLRELLRAERVR